MEVRRVTYIVPPHRDGQKVETVARSVWGLSGTQIRRIKWLEDGFLLDGNRVFVDVKVSTGQVLSVRLSDPLVRSEVEPVPGPLDVVYRDGDMLVVNKSAGVTCHPGPGHWRDTLGNFLMDYYAKEGICADYHPVHRLDKGTTGLMVVALHPHAQEVLKKQLHTQDFHRRYLALCQGCPMPAVGTIEAPIGRAEDSILARGVRADGQRACTHYRVLGTRGEVSLVQLDLETGRTHQIRVHLAHLGHPLIGDFLYGTEEPDRIPRPALHSAYLEIKQPITGEIITLEAPMPADMQRVWMG